MKKDLIVAYIIGVLVSSPALAHSNKSHPTKDSRIETAVDVQKWCKKESARYLKRKKMAIYNWTVTTIRSLNHYHSTGSWQFKNRSIKVSCSIQIGRKAKYTKIEIPEEI